MMERNRTDIENTRQIIIEKYGLSELLCVDSINESVFSTTKDVNLLKEDMKLIAKAIPDMILRLTKIGLKATVNATVKYAKQIYKSSKNNKEALQYLFYSLLFFTIGYVGNTIKDKYNERPLISGTSIQTTQKDGIDVMIVNDGPDKIFVSRNPNQSIPEMKTVYNANKLSSEEAQKQNESSPIRLLKPGEVKIQRHTSSEMLKALADVEHFVDHIYDTADKTRKITRKDMGNLKMDLTIGYGHKLTVEERKKWSPDKKVTREQAMELFKKDVAANERILNNYLAQLPYDAKVNYSQGFYDGVLSLLFNMGAGNLTGAGNHAISEFWRRLGNCRIDKENGCINKSDIDYTLAQVNKQNVFLPGYKTRRRAEYFIAMQPYGKINPKLYNLKG
jgi:GH24 family phage-related lysozyme (muramidase)